MGLQCSSVCVYCNWKTCLNDLSHEYILEVFESLELKITDNEDDEEKMEIQVERLEEEDDDEKDD